MSETIDEETGEIIETTEPDISARRRASGLRAWATKLERFGSREAMNWRRPKSAIARFEAKYIPEPNSGCWLWTGGVDRDGYGMFYAGPGKAKSAHIFSYEAENGPIPDGLTVDHLCRVRCCVNPQHLEAVTFAVNVSRGTQGLLHKMKTHCRNGHPYSGDNLKLTSNGERVCKTCASANSKRYHEKKKAGRAADAHQ